MSVINKEKAYENAEFLKEKSNSTSVFIESLSILKMNKVTWKRKLLFIIIEICVAIVMAMQIETISLTKDVMTLIITVIIALVAIVFTGYAFFQALINDTLLVTLMSVDIESEGNLYKTNKYFAKVFIFQILCLMLNLILVVFMIILPNEWCLFKNSQLNELVATIGLVIVFYMNFEGIWEMKSFIFNVFQLFNLHAYSRLVRMKNRGE